MKIYRWILIVMVLAMVAVCILTWGSLGSAVMIFCLITMGAALLMKRFLIDRDGDYFQEE